MKNKYFKCANCFEPLQTRIVITYKPFDKKVFGEVMLREDYDPLYQKELHSIEVCCHKCGLPKVQMQDLFLLTKVGNIVFRQNSFEGDYFRENNQLKKEDVCQVKI